MQIPKQSGSSASSFTMKKDTVNIVICQILKVSNALLHQSLRFLGAVSMMLTAIKQSVWERKCDGVTFSNTDKQTATFVVMVHEDHVFYKMQKSGARILSRISP